MRYFGPSWVHSYQGLQAQKRTKERTAKHSIHSSNDQILFLQINKRLFECSGHCGRSRIFDEGTCQKEALRHHRLCQGTMAHSPFEAGGPFPILLIEFDDEGSDQQSPVLSDPLLSIFLNILTVNL